MPWQPRLGQELREGAMQQCRRKSRAKNHDFLVLQLMVRWSQLLQNIKRLLHDGHRPQYRHSTFCNAVARRHPRNRIQESTSASSRKGVTLDFHGLRMGRFADFSSKRSLIKCTQIRQQKKTSSSKEMTIARAAAVRTSPRIKASFGPQSRRSYLQPRDHMLYCGRDSFAG